MNPTKIIEIIIELEGEAETDPEELAEELEGYVTTMCPRAYRVNAYVTRDEEV